MKALKTLSEAYVVIGSLVAPILLASDLGYGVACALGLASVVIAGFALQS